MDEGGSSTDSEFTGAACKTHDCSGPAVRRNFHYCTDCRTPGAGKTNWLPKSNKSPDGRPLHTPVANPTTPTVAALARAVAAPSVVQYGDGTGYNPADYMPGAVGVGDDMLTWWSFFITKANRDIEYLYFFRGAEWCQEYCERFGLCTERGGQKNQLHLQGLALIRSSPDAHSKTRLSNSIKSYFPLPVGAGYRVDIKPFEGNQNPLFMLGYVQKDIGEPWFNLAIKGFSMRDCIVGRAIHFSQISGFENGKKKLSKSDFVGSIHLFYSNNLYPLHVSICQIIRFMILTGNFIPAQTWLTSGQGRGFALDKASIHFKWASHPTACTVGEVQAYFFDASNTTSIRRLDNTSMHRNPVTEFEPDNSDRADFIRIDGAWVNDQWVYENDYDDMSFGTAKELAFHKRQDSELTCGIDEINPDDVDADDEPYECATIVAKDGVHMWNQSNSRYTRRSELDLNFSNGTAFDLDEEYLNSSGDDTIPASPGDLTPAESPPSYDMIYVPDTPEEPSAVAQLPVVEDRTLPSVVATERGF